MRFIGDMAIIMFVAMFMFAAFIGTIYMAKSTIYCEENNNYHISDTSYCSVVDIVYIGEDTLVTQKIDAKYIQSK